MKHFTKFLSLILSIIMIFGMLSVMHNGYLKVRAIGDLPNANGALGTEESPYIVNEPSDLVWMSNNVDTQGGKYYIQTANIDMSGVSINPIGYADENDYDPWCPFYGTYDGQWYTISNLSINSDWKYVGLFGYVGTGYAADDLEWSNPLGTGNIKNTILNNATVNASCDGAYVGGLIGYIIPYSGTASAINCHVTGVSAVSGATNTYIGGVVGNSCGGSIIGCSNNASVSASADDTSNSYTTGGVVGMMQGTITNCSNTGNVYGGKANSDANNTTFFGIAGGVVGYLSGNVSYCYSSGNITYSATGDNIEGGVIGNYYSAGGSVQNTFFLDTSATYGINHNAVQPPSYSGATSKTASELKDKNTFSGWSFSNVWRILADENPTHRRPPINIVAEKTGTQMDVSWSAVTGATGYKVYLGTARGVYGAPAATIAATSATITGLDSESIYYLVVTATDADGESPYSYVTVLTPPAISAAISPTSELNEGNLDTNSLTVSLSGTTFTDNTLAKANFTLNNAPTGVTIESVSYLNDTQCTINLAFDGTDFDVNVTTFGITIDGAELLAESQLTSGTLTITATVETAPSISTHPSNATVNAGNNTSFTIEATGTGLNYQWQVNTGAGFGNIINGGVYSDATTATLNITGATGAMNGYTYRCVVTGTVAPAATSNTVTLTVNTVPTINTQPSNEIVVAGSNTSFTVEATGTGLTYQWQVNTGAGFVNIANGGVYSTTTTATLNITGATAGMNGFLYRVVITGAGALTTTSDSVLMTVNIPPSISTHPSNATVNAGNNTSFTVEATGTGLNYQWQVNTGAGFENIINVGVYSNATTATLNITGATGAMNGYTYRCVVTGTAAPAATSNTATLTVNTVPTINTQPSNVTVDAGSNTSFTVEATGTGLTYQWQVNAGVGFVNIANGGVYSTATTATLNITGATADMNGFLYRVVITGAGALTATSDSVSMTVNIPPSISTHPSDATVNAGNNTSFIVEATGTGLNYQWQVNTGAGFENVIDGGVYSNATTATLNITGATGAMNGYTYRCVVTGTAAPAATSNTATLTVNTVPTINTQPSNATVVEGSNTSFTVEATGTGLTYQWQVNAGVGFVNIANGGVYSTATTATLNITGATADMNGFLYRVVVTGAGALTATSDSVSMTVNIPPSISTHPSNATVNEGNNSSFIVEATGTGLNYQWQVNTGAGFENVIDGGVYSNATTATLNITGATGAMNGYTYRSVVTGTAAPAATSNTATLTVNTVPTINTQPSNATVVEGSNTSFTVEATGTGLTYQWQVNAGVGFVNIANGGVYSTATTATLNITGATADMNGFLYRVVVTGAGALTATSNSISMTVNIPPAISTHPSNVTVNTGNNTSFTVTATGTGLTYQWQVNTGSGFGNIINGGVYSNATTSTLNITGATGAMNSYTYRVVVTGTVAPAATSDTAKLTVFTPSSSGNGVVSATPTPAPTPTPTPIIQPSQEPVIVIVNGKEQNAGKETKETQEGKSTVTVEVNNKVIESKIDDAIKNKSIGTGNILQVPVADIKSEVAKVELTGDIIKKLEENTFDVSVKRDNIEYVIPAEEFTISKVAENLGVPENDLVDIKVEVKISKLDEKVIEKYNQVAKGNGTELVLPPVSFEVIAKTQKEDGTTGTVKINKFSNYVERVMEIPKGVDLDKITTGIVFNADGSYSHVPTEVFQKEGKLYAKLNSLTNSEYSIVWNPITIKSVDNHWAKDAVNDMASRLVIFNPDSFEPNKAITRSYFAEYIIRALGLYREGSMHENRFADIFSNSERTLAILIANEYGIVTGYPDGSFRPDQQITREEAMAMYQRAMKVTKLIGSDKTKYMSYMDFAKVSDWAEDSVKEVLSAHVFIGTTATTISPQSSMTYAEAAQAIKNLLVESKLIDK